MPMNVNPQPSDKKKMCGRGEHAAFAADKKYLAIDTSGDYLTVIAKNGDAVVTFEPDCAMQHSVRLMDAVEETFSKAHLTPAACDFFCAVTGPGSFTGIRIGISTVKGFAAALAKPVLGVTSFAALAYNAEGKALAAIPAGRGCYYVCGFAEDKSVCLSPAYVDEAKLEALAAEYPVYAYAPLSVPYTKADPAAGLLRAVACAREEDFGGLSAFYLKKSQAEEARESARAQERPVGESNVRPEAER